MKEGADSTMFASSAAGSPQTDPPATRNRIDRAKRSRRVVKPADERSVMGITSLLERMGRLIARSASTQTQRKHAGRMPCVPPLARRAGLTLGLCAVVACAGQRNAVRDSKDYASTPKLPSPHSGTYARAPSTPRDPVIASITGHHTWDASLAGAAAGLAVSRLMDDRSITAWRAREAAWRAGYPYPVVQIRAWSTEPQSEPPDALIQWLGTVPKTSDLGLVRARDADMEIWLAMVGNVRHDVGVHPRHVNPGSDHTLPLIDDLTFQLVAPSGHLTSGSLATKQAFILDEQGEWLTVINDAEGRVAAWPTYVGILPPSNNLLDEINITASQQLELDVLDALNEVRAIYGAPMWTRTPVLDALAATLHEDTSRDIRTLGESLGYAAEKVHAWSCRLDSTYACLDAMLWEPTFRRGLLGDSTEAGVHLKTTSAGVTLMGVAASE